MRAVYITDITPLMNKEVYEYYYERVGKIRQKKADRLKMFADKARSVGVGAVLRFAVEDSTDYNYDNLEFYVDTNGKPRVKDDIFYFSLSHSGKYAVCAISDTPIGVDIELDRELSEGMKKRFAADVTEWTKKEAKGKLTGKGVLDNGFGEGYVFTSKKTDGYVITVCCESEAPDLLYYHLPYPG